MKRCFLFFTFPNQTATFFASIWCFWVEAVWSIRGFGKNNMKKPYATIPSLLRQFINSNTISFRYPLLFCFLSKLPKFHKDSNHINHINFPRLHLVDAPATPWNVAPKSVVLTIHLFHSVRLGRIVEKLLDISKLDMLQKFFFKLPRLKVRKNLNTLGWKFSEDSWRPTLDGSKLVLISNVFFLFLAKKQGLFDAFWLVSPGKAGLLIATPMPTQWECGSLAMAPLTLCIRSTCVPPRPVCYSHLSHVGSTFQVYRCTNNSSGIKHLQEKRLNYFTGGLLSSLSGWFLTTRPCRASMASASRNRAS